MAGPSIGSPEEAGNLARLIQQGKIQGPARDQAMQALRDYDTTSKYTPDASPPQMPPAGMSDDEYQQHMRDWRQQMVNDMPTGQRFWLGMGKGVNDLGQGIGQWFGTTSREDVARERQQDAPLMSTPSARWGVTAGKAMMAVPSAFIPGAGTLTGAALIGGGLGAAEPSTSTGETAGNIGLGAAAGPLGLLVGRGAGALWQGGKALLEPFLKGGSDKIAGRVLQSFAGNPGNAQKLATALQNPPQVLPGVQPTTAEVAGSPGLNGLERTMNNKPEFNQDLTTRLQSNNAATSQAVQGIAGTPADLEAAQAARAAASNPLYKAAGDVRATSDDTLNTLMQRPSMQQAWGRAQELAAERGEQLVEGRDVMPGAPPSGATPTGAGIKVESEGAVHHISTSDGSAGMRTEEAGNQLLVRNSFVPPNQRGQGVGSGLYAAAADLAQKRGLGLASDVSVSPDAQRMWESLRRQGYDVRVDPRATTDATGSLSTGSLPNRGPVYSISPESVARGPATSGAAPAAGVGPSAVGARPAILSPADEAAGNQLVTVDPGKLDAGWTGGMRVGPNGEGGIIEPNGLSRYDRAKDLYQAGHTMEAPSVDVNARGGVTFIDGRHRAAAMRDLGDSAITVAMDPQSVANARAAGMLLEPQHFTDYSGRALQYLKMALQDTINQGEARGMGAHELAATKSTFNALQNWITKNVPELRSADQAFAQGSVPVNQMQIGQKLSDSLRPALSDFSSAPNRLNANAFAQSMRGGDRLARQVTGDETATLAGTLSPDQQSTLRLVGEQLARRSAVNDVGRAVGSNTAQNLIGENFANQALGPLGLPQNAVGRLTRAVLGAALAKPYQLAAGAAEPDVQKALTDALLNPSSAARLLSQPVSPRYAQTAWRNQRFLTPAAAQTALATQGVQ